MIKPDLLKCFIAAADTGSFSAAGRKIGKHLATVSGNISRLEDELGLLLFDREGKYPQLTAAGLNLYDSAKVIVDSVERFTLSATQLSAGIPAAFTIAIDEDINLQSFTGILRACQQQWPHLRITVMVENAKQIFEGVRQQNIDFAVVPSLEGNSQFYEFKAVGHSAVYIICAKQHGLAKKRLVRNDDLMSHTQIISRVVQENQSLYQVTKMSPLVWFANGHQSILQLVEAGIGWAFINATRAQLPDAIYVLAPEFVETNMQIQYDVIWPKNQPITEVHKFLIEQTKAFFHNNK